MNVFAVDYCDFGQVEKLASETGGLIAKLPTRKNFNVIPSTEAATFLAKGYTVYSQLGHCWVELKLTLSATEAATILAEHKRSMRNLAR